MDYFVFRDRRSEGPYSEEELLGHVQGGRYALGDLGRSEADRHWTPLRNLLPGGDGAELASEVVELPALPALPAAAEPEAAREGRAGKATRYGRLVMDFVQRVRGIFVRFPVEAGVLCVAVGCAIVVLSFFPPLLFGPWLLAALFAGGMLLLRDRMAAGLGLCAAAVFLPVILWLLLAHLTHRA